MKAKSDKTYIESRKFWQDPSTWVLILTNILIIVLAVIEQWNLVTIMWIYWSQSVIIGLINFVRILSLKNFSTKGMKMGGKFVEANSRTKVGMAFFFLFHYGGFQAAYAVFIADAPNIFGKSFAPPELRPILISSGIFLVNHVFSFAQHFHELSRHQELGKLMGIPYIRIIPMHIVIIIMAVIPSPLVAFLLLRMVVDVVMHAVEHRSRPGTVIP